MSKEKVEMKKFRAIVTFEFDAPDRATALKRAKEAYDSPHSTVRVQEATVAWMTIPDAAPTS